MSRVSFAILTSGLIFIPLVYSAHILDPFTPTKWIAIYLVLIFALFARYLDKEPFVLPDAKRTAFIVGIALLHSASLLFHLPTYWQGSTLELFAIFATILISFDLIRQPGNSIAWIYRLNAVALVTTALIVLLQFMKIEIVQFLPLTPLPAATFGFQNMTAEFLGISSLIHLAYISWNRREKSMFHNLVDYLMPSAGLVFAFALQSRATWVSIIAAVLFLFWRRYEFINLARVALLSIPPITMILILVFSPLVSMFAPANMAATKQNNIQIRLIRWANTLESIKSNPFTGLGPGGYEFGYQPYSFSVKKDPEAVESMVVRSPHNSYLKVISEYGIPISILFFAVAVGVCTIFLRTPARSLEGDLFLTVACFIAVDAIFAFPFEQAYPSYIAVLTLGLALSKTGELKSWRPLYTRMAGVSVLVLLFPLAFLSSRYISSKLTEAAPDVTADEIQNSCENFPDNWRVCVRYGSIMRQSNQFAEALDIFSRILRYSPYNFVAIRERATTFAQLNMKDDACSDYEKYNSLFGDPPRGLLYLESLCAHSK